MKVLLLMFAHLLTTVAKLLGAGGAKAIVADSLLMKQQLLIINRSRRRAPNLTPVDRMLLGFWSLFLSPHHIQRAAVILKPTTLFKFHDILKKRKYRLLYTARRKGKPGPKGPSQELIEAIVELKRRNTRFGCPRIAQEINKAFGLNIDKDVVRRVLEKHYRPGPDSGDGPSWLTFIGHLKDSLWSIDLFRCESILLNTHWVLVVMDQFTRRIIGFGVENRGQTTVSVSKKTVVCPRFARVDTETVVCPRFASTLSLAFLHRTHLPGQYPLIQVSVKSGLAQRVLFSLCFRRVCGGAPGPRQARRAGRPRWCASAWSTPDMREQL